MLLSRRARGLWLGVIAMGTSRFVAAGTNIPPNLPTALVVGGIYGRLYLGATLVYLGLSVAAGTDGG